MTAIIFPIHQSEKLFLKLCGNKQWISTKELRKCFNNAEEDSFPDSRCKRVLEAAKQTRIFNECCETYAEIHNNKSCLSRISFQDFCLETLLCVEIDKEVEAISEKLSQKRIFANELSLVGHFILDVDLSNYFLHESNVLIPLASPDNLKTGLARFKEEHNLGETDEIDADEISTLVTCCVRYNNSGIICIKSLLLELSRLQCVRETASLMKIKPKASQYSQQKLCNSTTPESEMITRKAETFYGMAFEEINFYRNIDSALELIRLTISIDSTNKVYRSFFGRVVLEHFYSNITVLEEAESIVSIGISLDPFWQNSREMYSQLLTRILQVKGIELLMDYSEKPTSDSLDSSDEDTQL